MNNEKVFDPAGRSPVIDGSLSYASDKAVLVISSYHPTYGWTLDLDDWIQEIRGLGGYVCFGKGQGEDAGVIARRILLGKSPSEIAPIIGKSGQFAWSRSQIVKWKIRIPAGWLAYSEFKE